MRKNVFLFLFLLLTFFLYPEKVENRDVIILVDISKSMSPVFNEVKGYLNNDLVSSLRIGDNLFIIIFYGKTETAYNKKIESQNDIIAVKNKISSLTASGPFTDIGNALDTLKSELAKRSDLNKSKYVLLLSDGSQEAPRWSKYYSPNKTISHEMLENARSIDKAGWKVQVLSIGGKEGLKKISQEMGAVYKETTSRPTKKELSEKNEDLFYKVDFSFKDKLGLIINKRKTIKGKAVSEFNRKVLIDISKVVLTDIERISKNGTEKNDNEIILREKSFSFVLNENESKNESIGLKFKSNLKAGNYKAKLKFYFSSDMQFSPTLFDVTFYYPNFILSNIFVLLLILLILAGLIYLAYRYAGGFFGGIFDKIASVFQMKKTLKYEVLGSALSVKKEILFSKNERKSFGGGGSIINIPASGIKDNIAFIALGRKGFEISVQKPEYFKTNIVKDKFLNKELEIKNKDGKIVKVKFYL